VRGRKEEYKTPFSLSNYLIIPLRKEEYKSPFYKLAGIQGNNEIV
jgi:hypothetical protein